MAQNTGSTESEARMVEARSRLVKLHRRAIDEGFYKPLRRDLFKTHHDATLQSAIMGLGR